VDKLRYAQRPFTLAHLCLAQFVAFYRVARAGMEDVAHQQAGALVPLAVALDTDLPPGHLTHLPAVLTLQDGQVVRRLREPRIIDWTPATTYSEIVMFKVNILNVYIS